MIPTFPEFKSIEPADKNAVTSITSRFSPYSDFNFTSMWSWNLKNEIALSLLHDNLVVLFTDYSTGEMFYSVLGTNAVNETIAQLLDYTQTRYGEAKLKLVPESVIEKMDRSQFNILEDRDNFDYIYDLEEISTFAGGKFAKKRKLVNLFLRDITHATSVRMNLNNEEDRDSLTNLFAKVDIQKEQAHKNHSYNPSALTRLFQLDLDTLVTTGIYINNALVAAFISELVNDEYALGHFMTADTSVHTGLYTYLIMKNAEALKESGASLFNLEQDLGLENLRTAKTRLRPVSFLKKYFVRPLHNAA